MLEFLINPKKAEKKPWEMLIIGFVYASLSIILATFLFHRNTALEKYTSIFMITFTIMFSIPFMYYTIRLEEKKDIIIKKEKKLIKEHGRALSAFIFLFLGYILAFSLAFLIMPQDVRTSAFQAQIETYCLINAGETQQCSQAIFFPKTDITTGQSMKSSMHTVSSILSNNFFVMITILIFSFLFGAGAIFILAWNASVIAAAIGAFTKGAIENLPLALLRYLIHGIPEIGAYFVTALAGGIISIAIIRHEFGKKEFWCVLQDSLDLIILALLILIFAAFIEVFITPRLISFLI